MSAKTRVIVIVALAAAATAGAVVGVTLLQTRGETTRTIARKGAPPLYLQTTGQLARAVALYDQGKRSEARVIFSRYHTLPAEIGAAFSTWPHGSLDAMKRLVASNPQSGVAELHLGLAYYWSGRDPDAVVSWQLAAKVEPDSPSAVAALDLLHPDVAPGLPLIVVNAAKVDAPARALLIRGIQLWDAERLVSARRVLARAAARAPRDPAVLTAAAVATFSPADPLRPFPKLGPLTASHPRASVIRFHLGELLLWTRQTQKGEQQLLLAVALQPRSLYARAANLILKTLRRHGIK